jgi:hypothetical protein
MAWNGSGGVKVNRVPLKKKATFSFKRTLFVLVGLTIIVGGFFLFQDNETEDALHEEGKKISPSRRKKEKAHVKTKDIRPHKIEPKKEIAKGPVDLGFGFYTNRAGEVKARTKPQFIIQPRKSKQLFTHPAEDFVSAIVSTQLGQPLYDDSVPENIEDLLKSSLTNKIVILEDDTPDVVETKRRTIEAKEALAEMMRSGHDIREILIQEKEFIKKKHREYLNILQGLAELRASNASTEEISEYALAGKQLMKELDIENPLPLKINESFEMARLEELIKNKNENPITEEK